MYVFCLEASHIMLWVYSVDKSTVFRNGQFSKGGTVLWLTGILLPSHYFNLNCDFIWCCKRRGWNVYWVVWYVDKHATFLFFVLILWTCSNLGRNVNLFWSLIFDSISKIGLLPCNRPRNTDLTLFLSTSKLNESSRPN